MRFSTPFPPPPPPPAPIIALEDYNLDGDYEFLVGDLGSGHFDMKLKSYKGTELVHQAPLLFIPTALCTFYIDNTEPRTPAIAVASGAYIYMYKNLHPYFKFTLPSLQVKGGGHIQDRFQLIDRMKVTTIYFLQLNSTEADLWEQVNNVRHFKYIYIFSLFPMGVFFSHLLYF